MKLADMAEKVRRSVTAKDVARMLGIQYNSAGFCCCPLHGEKTASMKLYPRNKGWYCFGCHRGGSVIDLVMEMDAVDLRTAIGEINDYFNLGLPVSGKPTPEQEEEARRLAVQREEEQRRRDALRKRQNEAYERWLDIGVKLAQHELDKREYAPQRDTEVWDERFCTALREIPKLRAEAADLEIFFNQKED